MDALWAAITGDLRLALLVLGALFLVVLLAWEFFQRRRARRADDAHVAGAFGQPRQGGGSAPRDPLLEGRESRTSRPSPGAATDDEGFVDGVGPVREIGGPSPVSGAGAMGDDTGGTGADGRREPTVTLPGFAARDRLPEPRVVDLDTAIDGGSDGPGLPVVDSVTLSDEPSLRPAPAPVSAPAPAAAPATVPAPPPAPTSPPVSAPPPAAAAPVTEPRAPIDDRERRIVALRIVARNGERFTGTSLRQALQGEGFVHGDLQIFHRLTGDGRTVLSAASLTRPGSFDLATMDATLFRGLNLFAVLPGPLSGRETVDKLLLSGHTIAQRLRGELLDSRGEALTEARLAEMRREASAGDPV